MVKLLTISTILPSVEERIGALFLYCEKRMPLVLSFFFTLSFAIRFYITNFDIILRKDAYVYLMKALEISQGNFTPVESQAIGLPLFTAPIFYFFGSESIFQNMALAQLISVIIGSAMIFPLFLLVKELTSKKTVHLLVLSLFTFCSPLIQSSPSFLTESLFGLLFLFSIYFFIRSIHGLCHTIPAFFFAALAYYVRPNGIFIFAILVFSFLLIHYKTLKQNYKYLLYGVIVFWVVSAPFLYQRADLFGSPFTYGENDKYFVNSYDMVWADNIEVPSLFDFIREYGLRGIIRKFIINGFMQVFFDFSRILITPILSIFFLYGFSKNIFCKKYIPLYISIIIFIAGSSVVYDVYTTVRYILVLAPFILLFVAMGLFDIFKHKSYSHIILVSFLVLFIFFSYTQYGKTYGSSITYMPSWATWAAQNIQGKIVIRDGGDLILMNIPDATVGETDQATFSAPETGLTTVRPGYFNNLQSAIPYLKNNDITHVAIESRGTEKRRPYLMQVTEPEYKDLFKEVYSNEDSDDPWKMKFYEIQWDVIEQKY